MKIKNGKMLNEKTRGDFDADRLNRGIRKTTFARQKILNLFR